MPIAPSHGANAELLPHTPRHHPKQNRTGEPAYPAIGQDGRREQRVRTASGKRRGAVGSEWIGYLTRPAKPGYSTGS
ncbi:MAG: hypothetical protein ACR2NN_20960 [Bryobacteraceae bacterium]